MPVTYQCVTRIIHCYAHVLNTNDFIVSYMNETWQLKMS